MKHSVTSALLGLLLLLSATAARADLIITGVIDGPLTGGIPKAVELYAINDIADLSIYGIGSASNGGGTDGEEFTLSGSATAGQFLYLASEENGFTSFFGFAPTFNAGTAVSINGDDAIELFQSGAVIDTFGEITYASGTGSSQPWFYGDGWAYRVSNTGPDGTVFNIGNWTFSGADALDGESSNGSAANPFPIGSFTIVPEPSAFALMGLVGLAIANRRRR